MMRAPAGYVCRSSLPARVGARCSCLGWVRKSSWIFWKAIPTNPLVTGRVYNADQMPPGHLPDKMNVSGWRTHSTKGGGEHDANVLAFDDTKGSEVFYMRAEKDMAVRVQNNEDSHIMNNQTITVDNDRTETVTKGNETVEIKQGNRTHKVTVGNESLTGPVREPLG